MKLSDYVALFLEKLNISHVFSMTGGAIVHLLDSLDRKTSVEVIFNHHEQASSFACEANAKAKRGLSVCMVTTGPGATNALTGLAAAWLDSIPCIFISGQARSDQVSYQTGLRQIGNQELDIISVVSSMTKYAVLIQDPNTIKYHLQKACFLATSGRPGPVWIDIPLNFQWEEVNPESLEEFLPPIQKEIGADKEKVILQIIKEIKKAKRPILVGGYGIRLAHGEELFRKLIYRLNIPFLTSWNLCDLLPSKHPLNAGRPGTLGQRGANLAIQNADLVLCVGSHLRMQQIGPNPKGFATSAKKILIHLDPLENQYSKVNIDSYLELDAKIFLEKMLSYLKTPLEIDNWRQKITQYQQYNQIKLNDQAIPMDACYVIDTLSDYFPANATIVVDGGGTVTQMSMLGLKFKENQSLILSSALTSMGSGLPEAIGAYFARKDKPLFCLMGDGSFQLNLQELQTIVHHQIPIKIFIFNNNAYLSIRQTQNTFLKGNLLGSSLEGGISLPSCERIAHAYGIKFIQLSKPSTVKDHLSMIINSPDACICEILVRDDQEVMPRIGFEKVGENRYMPKPLEDMFPYLDREELNNLMKHN